MYFRRTVVRLSRARRRGPPPRRLQRDRRSRSICFVNASTLAVGFQRPAAISRPRASTRPDAVIPLVGQQTIPRRPAGLAQLGSELAQHDARVPCAIRCSPAWWSAVESNPCDSPSAHLPSVVDRGRSVEPWGGPPTARVPLSHAPRSVDRSGRGRQARGRHRAKGRLQVQLARRRVGNPDRDKVRLAELEDEVETLTAENARLRSALAMAGAILALAETG